MDPRFPIGDVQIPAEANAAVRAAAIDAIAEAPAKVRAAVHGLSAQQLDTPYRDGGWTVRQVVHHLVDSHINAYIRLRLALTEDSPTIKPYDENTWANLPDAKSSDIGVSLALLDALHERWVRLWRVLKPEQFSRPLVHPERGPRNVDWLLWVYSWHGKHHVAHITELRKARGW